MHKGRGRQPQIPKNFYDFDFAKAAKSESVGHIRAKLLALEQIKTGKSYKIVATIFNVHRETVKAWVMSVSSGGLHNLKIKHGRGRKSKLPENKIPDFKQAIIELQAQRKGGRINASDIAKMAQEKFKIVYQIKSIYDLLRRIDMVWISARSVHPAQNLVQQEAFKKTL